MQRIRMSQAEERCMAKQLLKKLSLFRKANTNGKMHKNANNFNTFTILHADFPTIANFAQ